MKMVSRALLSLLVLLATLFLANCGGHYFCNVTFGSSTCNPSGSGSGPSGGSGGGGGGGGSQPSAFVFAVDQGGTIDGYTLSVSGGTFGSTSNYTAPTVPTNDGGVGMAVAQGQFLYAGFGAAQELYGWTINSSGSLTAISGFPLSISALGGSNGGVGQNNIITDPTGSYLFISDALAAQVYAYVIGSGGTLSAAATPIITLPAGFEPMNLATDGMGKYLYIIDGDWYTHQGSEIAAYVIGTGGTLTAVPGSPFIGPPYNMWQVQGEPTGDFLIGTTGSNASYAGVSDDLHLYVFSITQSGASAGAITQVTGSPFTTQYSPFTIAVSPAAGGDLVYSFGFNDAGTAFNPTEGYSLSTTGTLTALTGSPFSNLGEGTWGQFDQSGAYLMDYGSYVNSSDALVTQLVPLIVGTDGVLSQPIATLDLTSGCTTTPCNVFWAVTDVP